MIAGTTTWGSRLPTWPAHIAATRARPVKCMGNKVIGPAAGMPEPDSAQNDTVVAANPHPNPETAARACRVFQSPPAHASLTCPGGMGFEWGSCAYGRRQRPPFGGSGVAFPP